MTNIIPTMCNGTEGILGIYCSNTLHAVGRHCYCTANTLPDSGE